MDLLIYGSGGLGRVVYDSVVRCNYGRWEKILFINDFVPEQEFYGTQTIHFETIFDRFEVSNIEVLIAVGEPSDREKLYKRLKGKGIRISTYVDNLAWVSPTAVLEEGTIVLAYSMIDSYARLGNNSLVQYHAVIGHDVKIGKNSAISPHVVIGGFTEVGNQVFIGLQAVLKDRIKIDDNVIVSMGAIVYRDIEEGMVVMGNPARATILKNNEHRVFK